MASQGLDGRRQKILTAMCRTVLPATDSPGADDLGVADVIVMKVQYMAHLQDLYEQGIDGADRSAEILYGKKFVELDDNEAKQLLTRVQTGQVPQEAWPAVSAPAFFHVLRMDVFFVYTTDPMIWERIGFPGAAIDHGGYRDIHRFPEPTP